MFTSTGIGIINPDSTVEEKAYPKFSWFTVELITKDPYKDKRCYLRLSISVPLEKRDEAAEAIRPGKALHVRISELSGIRTERGTILMGLKSKWKWVEPIKALPTSKRSNYEDV